ncbi:hypothetical protein GCM10023340_09280 [Nocardioides marinquilinus]|uniref:Abortive phage infection protein C-terminal domain-containing protein n=1 Tax=Nocardioides marinquilinus TaxID=1210400 RepID=A0ABP9PH79_9ACTN
MTTNDLFLLDQRRSTRHKAQSPDMSEDEFFNVFVSELLTQDFQLPGPEYLQYGIVDGPQDCGIDAIYTFVNGMLVTDEFRKISVPRNPDLDLLIIQCKTSPTFSESPVEKLAMHVPELLNLDRSEARLSEICNPALLQETRRFLDVYSDLAAKRPRLRILMQYVSRGAEPSQGVRAKAEIATSAVAKGFRDAEIAFDFVGGRALIDLARRPTRLERVIPVAEGPLASETGDGYVGLIRLRDYFEFIKDPVTGRLDAALFEANVREHEGETDVNSDIHATLHETDSPYDFWWLNNGVTIVAEDVATTGKRLTLTSPQIVNGLQTSTEIFKHFAERDIEKDARLLLVRIVRAEESRLRDKIVKATNSQNELPLSALRATEPFQRDIEEFLAARGYYYDRKRNYSRTRGYDDKRVVSMAFAGQAVVSCLLQRPDLCRSGGAGLLNDDALYDKAFNDQVPLSAYLNVIWLLRKTQSALVNDRRVKGTSVEDWQFHVAMVSSMLLTRKTVPSASDLASMNIAALPTERISDVMEIVAVEYGRAIPPQGAWTFGDLSTDERVLNAMKDRTSSLLKSVHWRDWPDSPVAAEFAVRASDVFYRRIRGD